MKQILTKCLVAFASISLLFFVGCIYDLENNTHGNLNFQNNFKATGILCIGESDFTSGLIEWIDLRKDSATFQKISIYNDFRLRSFGKYIFALERQNLSTVSKVDPLGGGLIYQKKIIDGNNLSDIEVVNNSKAYISQEDNPEITVFNPESGKIITSINIKQYAFENEKSPYATDMVIGEGFLYVLLQRRKGYEPGASSLVLKISTNSDSIVDTIACKYKNGSSIVYANNFLYIANPGNTMKVLPGDGGIEKINLTTKEVSTIIEEDVLGGNPSNLVHATDSILYVVNAIKWQDAPVVKLNANSGKIISLKATKDAFGEIYYDKVDSILYVGERDPSDIGVKMFKDTVQIGATIKTSLPPTGIVIAR